MAEIQSELSSPPGGNPLNPFEALVFRTYFNLLEFQHWPHSRITDAKARRHKRVVENAIIAGQPNSLNYQTLRKGLFGEFSIIASGIEHLPPEGAYLVLANHTNTGRLAGNHQVPVMSDALQREVRIIMASQKKTGESGNRIMSLLPQNLTNPLDRLSARIMGNLASVCNYIPTEIRPRSSFRAIENGEVVGLYPTGKSQYAMSPVLPEAVKYIVMITRHYPGLPLVPIGCYLQRDLYRVSIGKPFQYTREDNPLFIAHDVGHRIAAQLPPPMKGFYR